MSLIIKGMEMPQAGDMIICGQIYGKLQCTIVTRGKPTKWCEASEVSAPHGRLIDADAFEKKLKRLVTSKEPYQRGIGKAVLLAMKCEPTVIEAEVSE